MNKINAIVLAAGAGTRMKSKTPKVLHKISGVPLVGHVVDLLEVIKVAKISVVIGHGREQVETYLQSREGVNIVYQEQRLGTGHAVMMAKETIKDDEDVLVLTGDTPLLRTETVEALIAHHRNGNYDATVLTASFADPTGYGRIVRDASHLITGIVEHRDANDEQRLIKEINSGIICMKGHLLTRFLDELKNDNVQGEYYLTDVIGLLSSNGYRVSGYIVEDTTEIMGINNRVQLAEADAILQTRIKVAHMENGVTFINPESSYLEKYVRIDLDTTIEPGCVLRGRTVIGSDCVIGPNADITNTEIKDAVEVKNSTLLDSMVASHTKIGPYAYLRPNSCIGEHVKIGDFVEVKNAVVGDGSKVSHLSYIGDGEIGKNVNIGCGVVFVNYDGKNKHKTTVKDGAFVGCNVNLVAPVTVEAGAYVAAGSTITKDVPEMSLGVARAKQSNIEKWVEKKVHLKK
ncbi:MAG: bifunctional UDP-N-acetylglucosamine diphosphorylase/glucosamine-1-phosphate N-acetyltransferase GlmU [Clostridia bacterium]|nr:bifunctional UDP-N-acetylglucosamine diphosphorylase/glucosamine-1-phosphate N-acetyltransferase GlmU [Clostridia bacterium]